MEKYHISEKALHTMFGQLCLPLVKLNTFYLKCVILKKELAWFHHSPTGKMNMNGFISTSDDGIIVFSVLDEQSPNPYKFAEMDYTEHQISHTSTVSDIPALLLFLPWYYFV